MSWNHRDPDRLRRAMNVEPGRPIVLFQGGFSIERGLEELVAAMDDPALCDLDVAVAFMGYGRLEAFLRGAAGAAPGPDPRSAGRAA